MEARLPASYQEGRKGQGKRKKYNHLKEMAHIQYVLTKEIIREMAHIQYVSESEADHESRFNSPNSKVGIWGRQLKLKIALLSIPPGSSPPSL